MASFPSLSVRSGNGQVGKRPFPGGRALFCLYGCLRIVKTDFAPML